MQPKKLLSLTLAFDDVLLKPGYSEKNPNEVELKTQLGPLSLNIPILSAAMDTVTESRTAIAMALQGGMGVLHKNCTSEAQALMVRKVKRFSHAMIKNPQSISQDSTLGDLQEYIKETGVTGFVVTDKSGKLVGVCTKRDFRYETDEDRKISEIMTKTIHSMKGPVDPEKAIAFFKKFKVEKLPIVDNKGKVVGLITSKDLRNLKNYPLAVRDEAGSLLVGAAIGVGQKDGIERAEILVSEGVDALVLDSAHGHSKAILETIKAVKKKYKIPVIAGNIATQEAAKRLIGEGADVVKVGIGPGSICTTRIVSGAGVPQLGAVLDVAEYVRVKHSKIGVIADGGIRFSGDLTKALAAGAHAVMLGSLLAGTDESPGEFLLYQGRSYKTYRGMGSLGAMKEGGKERYRQGDVKEASKLVPEGVEARVPYRGALSRVLYQLLGGLRSGMGYVGAGHLVDLWKKGEFVQISSVGLKESHVHDVDVTKEAPNYQMQG